MQEFYNTTHKYAKFDTNMEFHKEKWLVFTYTVKPVLSGHSKIEKTEVLKTSGSLMEVESISECSLEAFCNTFDLH